MESRGWLDAFSIASSEEITAAFSLVALAWCGASAHAVYLCRRGASASARYGPPLLGAVFLVLIAMFVPRRVFLAASCCTLALWVVCAVRLPRPAGVGKRLLALLFGLAWCVPIQVASILVLMPR